MPEVAAGKIWCFDKHIHPVFMGDRGPEAFDTFSAWLFHRLFVHYQDTLRGFWMLMAREGFLDTIPYGNPPKHDGGIVFWRWDFWNSGYAKEWEAFDRRHW